MEFIKEGTYTHASSPGAAPSRASPAALALKRGIVPLPLDTIGASFKGEYHVDGGP
ncbi:hypothetical protein [Bordetella petrii]|uniref:hypothetical protein n=1 Tax=Bordetella petrii TaxID=94624 RepID=UPI0003192452|nr:hypothetical protein [Bordetella petrii]